MVVTADHSRRLADLHRRWAVAEHGAVARRAVAASADVVQTAGHSDPGSRSRQLRQHIAARVLRILTDIQTLISNILLRTLGRLRYVL